MVQNFLIILLIWNFNKSIGALEKVFVFVFFSAYAYVLFTDALIPQQVWTVISSSSTVLGIAGKVPQIWTNFSTKSTGQMAFFTFLLAWLGSIARLGTVLVESDDLLFRLQYITGCVLNTLIVLQFALYWNAPK